MCFSAQLPPLFIGDDYMEPNMKEIALKLVHVLFCQGLLNEETYRAVMKQNSE